MRNFRTLKEYFIRYKWMFVIGIFALLIVDILQLYIPRIIKYAIDDITQGGINRGNLIHYALWIVGLAVGIAGLRFFWRYWLIGTARKVEEQLRNKLFSHLQSLGMNFFKDHKIGDLMAHATNDINAVRMAMAFGVIGITDIVILGVLSLVFMILISARLTLYAIIPFPLLSFIVLRFARLIHYRFERVQGSFATLTAQARENIEGIRVIKAYHQEEGEIKQFDGLSQNLVNKNMHLVKIWGLFFPLIFMFANLSTCIILWFGGLEVILTNISIGDFVAFQAYLGILIWPMIAIGWVTNVLQRGAASMGRINKLLDTVPETVDTGDTSITSIDGEVEFANVSFSYNGTETLKKVSFSVGLGEALGVAGTIGSGKSTLAALIMRLYNVSGGEIKIDGKPIATIPMSVIRRNTGYVPQDTFLFSDTISANIAFGRPEASESDVYKAAKMARIYNEIMEFPKGFDEVVGERGITLSGGQCQRIAIARAILIKPKILILDNALSSVDIEKGIDILHDLREEFKERVLIVISHRIRNIAGLDKTIVLDEGKVIESGTHKELLVQKGIYFDFFQKQELEEKW